MPLPFDTARARRAAVCTAAAAVAAVACGEDPVMPGSNLAGRAGTPPTVGSLVRLNAYTDAPCDTVRSGFRGGRVVAVSARAIIVADTLNPVGGFTSAEYASFATSFDTLAYPVDVRNFGEPTDLDENGRVVIFFTTAVNALTPRSADFVVGGFFWNRDLFPKTAARPQDACLGSNDGELFYMLAPDPAGTVNGNARSKEYVARTSVAVLGHEFQHLINASRRLYVLNTERFDEEVWLNEGLSHAAEELMFFQASGLAPRRNLTLPAVRSTAGGITALNAYNVQNLARLSDYLGAPEANAPYTNNDSLATRGATWSFLRYAADRAVAAGAPNDSAFYYRLVNSTRTGLPNLQAALAGASGGTVALPDWFRDWAVAAYADDLVTGLDARFTQPSWNFRDALAGLSSNGNSYPLATRVLADGQAQTVTLAAGGSAYLRLSVPTGGQATVTIGGAGGGNPPALVRASLVGGSGTAAVRTLDPGTSSVTAPGGVGVSTPYALVLFNADTVRSARSSVTVTATGIGATALVSRTAAAGPTLARLAAAATSDGLPVSDVQLHARLRAIGYPVLAGRVAAARAEYAARRAGAARQ